MSTAPLLAPALFYLTGLLLGEAARYFPLTVFLFLFVSVPILVRLPTRLVGSPRVMLVLLGLLLLGLLARQFQLVQAEKTIGIWSGREKVELQGKVKGFPLHGMYGTRFRLRSEQIRKPPETEWSPVEGDAWITVREPEMAVLPGERLQFLIRLSPPRGYWNPGVFDRGSRLYRLDIDAVGNLPSSKGILRLREGHGVAATVQKWRDQIRKKIVTSTEGPARAILLAMILGEDGYLTESLREIFMASGTVHILSISGSHLGLLSLLTFAIVFGLIRFLPISWLRRLTLFCYPAQVAAWVTFLPVTSYALLAGAATATLRSLIMVWVYLFAVLLGRRQDVLNSLAFAALLTMAWDPGAPLDPSFQFSYLSVAAIAAVTEGWTRRSDRDRPTTGGAWRNRLLFSLAVTLAVTFITGPLSIYHFHRISWVGIVANGLAVPIAGFLIVPLGLLSVVLSLLFGTEGLPWAAMQTGIIDLFVWVVGACAGLPAAQHFLPSPSLPLLLLFLLSALLALFCRGSVQRVSVVAALLVAIVWTVFMVVPSERRFEMTFLDIGQGDTAVVRFPEGQVMVIDAGTRFGEWDIGRAVVAPYLWQQRIRTIDYLVATHPQRDHIGGMISILRRFPVGEVWTNGERRNTAVAQDFEQEIVRRQIPVRSVHRGNPPETIGGCRITFIHPSGLSVGPTKNANDRSLVFRIDCPEDFSALMTGDIEATAAREITDTGLPLSTDVLKVPHHGSRGSLFTPFLQRVSPRVAVISAGARNPFGHPSPEVLSAYRTGGAEIARTDRHGAIRIDTKEGRLRIRRYSEGFLQAVALNGRLWQSEWENYRRVFDDF